MKYYIADLHIGHANINTFDHRGFTSIDEMNEHIINQWNSVVKAHDEVYILGDMFWYVGDTKKIVRILNQMRGKKYLIIGNHDKRWLDDYDNDKYHCFNWIKDYAEVRDNRRDLILCHYPIMSYNHQFNSNAWMLHGHIHFTDDVKLVESYKNECDGSWRSVGNGELERPYHNIINCFCVASNYKPLTLDQWIEMELAGKLNKTTSTGE